MSGRYFYGWNVVAATFVMTLFSFGLGFYGLSIYVATLHRIHGWSASVVSAPVTVYYVAGALLTMVIGAAFERFGPRVVVCVGSVAMAAGVAALGSVTQQRRDARRRHPHARAVSGRGQEAIGGADPGTRSGVPRRRVPSTGPLSCLGSRDTGVQNGADSNSRCWRGAPRMHRQRIR